MDVIGICFMSMSNGLMLLFFELLSLSDSYSLDSSHSEAVKSFKMSFFFRFEL